MFGSIIEYVSRFEDKISLVVRDIRSREEIRINSDKQFAAASTMKISVMWEFYKKVVAGEAAIKDRYVLQRTDKVGTSVYDCGILRELHDGLELTFEDILTLMIIISDDTATNILLDKLGMENITKTMHDIGLKKYHYTKAYDGL